jgi:hypothetical protein
MTDAEYHAHPAYSATRLKAAATGTMLDYWASHVNPDRAPFVPTEAMRQGSLVDCLETEPHNFGSKYVILLPDAPKKPTKAQINAKKPSAETLYAIDWWEDFNAKLSGRDVITSEWYTTARAIIQRLRNDPVIGPILAKFRSSQVPHFWTDSQGRECRYKPDLETEDGELWDLKKARSANPRLFRAQSYQLGYDIQVGGHYREGFIDRHRAEPTRIGIIAYEWKYPYNCALLPCDDAFIELGQQRREESFARIEACKESGVWPSYGEATLAPPSYADMKAADDETNLDDLGLEGLES